MQPWAASSTTIPEGDGGTIATLALMRQLALGAAVNPDVREVAAVLAGGRNDPLLLAERIRTYVTRHTTFLPDPVGEELLTSPVIGLAIILLHGDWAADCDDVAMLIAALARAMGLRARFVAVAFHGATEPCSHVWAEAWAPGGWVKLDPSLDRRDPDVDVNAVPTRMVAVELSTGDVTWLA